MDLIVKKASSFTTEELEILGLTGIPADWPIESYPYVDTVPSGFEQMTDVQLLALKANNQAAYDVWVASNLVQSVRPPDAPRNAAGIPLVDHSNKIGIAGASSITVSTHDFTNRTTWYQKSVEVVEETLVDSGDGLTFTSANPNWIHIDHLNLTYDYGLIPERDGTHTKRDDRRVVVLVDAVQINDTSTPATPGYDIDYAAGTITFEASQAGKVVKATYWHNNGVARCSEWILNPPMHSAFLLDYIEMQFSANIGYTTYINVEIWAGGTLEDYSDFNRDLYDMGYGQNRSVYRGPVDFLNICTNRSSQIIPAFGGLANDVLIFPFDYLIQSSIRSYQGTVVMFRLVGDIPYTGELATGTFYMQLVPESTLPAIG